ncbi:PREDICTED: kinesin-like protein KIN-5D [Nicotiana attenuata]|uniref:Kinesin-like protein kin-5d n=1 Tax=Nicotiana attenuata TaxID=49451 RepID=A0A1J6ICK5_NICAT|nr:PREDICTED: kinesin-like protein KIN-5D [Nicotiana attenuata]OIT02314.1 kinesin-like protein kin-5d [Nicotiana attenuata]
MESSQSQQQQRRGGGGYVTRSPSQTPRSSDKAARDLRSVEGNMSGKHHDKDKGVNVQVIVRCRPLSEDEMRLNTPAVISCNEGRREISAMQNIANKQIDKTFVFDKVFGPMSKQKDLYDSAICPIVFEVLEGYNCTVFAYGQTGTGKTYTMEGGGRKKNGEFPSDAGVIPRAIKQIFDILEAQSAEYSVKVTFLELYNEEITDLLAPEECNKFTDDKSKKPLALMEDGKGGVFVRGLEEEIVCSANEIYNVLEKGSAKRRTAETLLNKQSSRSHSIFSITIHIKEYTPEGEEMIKCGKLNLVDLAGSENISRSGAREGRAREAGEINKSLLTLGRVINSLVEHSGHVPYRESKITRLLRDSLGGKTKTCIIATISPSIHSMEETLSTLDYAHRAKNIKNKPEINQKMMKSALMKDLYSEIERLKQEVYAAREKNGIYIPRDRYLQEEAEKKAMSEKIEKMELDLESKDKQLMELQELYNSQQLLTTELSDKLDKTERKLQETQHTLADLEDKHRLAIATIKEKEFLITNLLKSEKSLVEQAFELRAELEHAASDVSNLFAKIERKDKIEYENKVLIQKFQSQLTQQLEVLHKSVSSSATQQEQQLKHMEEDMQSFVSSKIEAMEELRGRLDNLKIMFGSGIEALDGLAGELDGNAQSTFDRLNSEFSKHSSALRELFEEIGFEANTLVNDLQKSLHSQEEKLIAFAAQQREAHCRTITTSRSFSEVTGNFFKTLDMHVSQLGDIVEDAQTVSDQKFSELEKKFEECAANEEKQILQKVAELLEGSNARKKKLVQTAINDLRESGYNRTSRLKQEMSTMQDSTTSVKAEWTNYMEKAECHYLEDTASVENGKKEMEEVLRTCLQKAKLGAEQWTNAQCALINLEERNVAFMDKIVSEGLNANEALRAQFSSGVSSTLEDTDIANKNLLSSIDHSLQLDRDACGNLDSMIVPCCGELRELKSGHYHKVVEITDHAGQCLSQEYMVDEPSCSTPKKRDFSIPSVGSIEELKTPPFEELLKSFWDGKSLKQANGDVKLIAEDAHSLRDSRLPLTTIN